jgi:hypothetical protein
MTFAMANWVEGRPIALRVGIGRVQLSALAAIVALQSGCSVPVRPDNVGQSPIGRVAVVGARFDPKYDFESLSKASAGAQGAGSAAKNCGVLLDPHDPVFLAVGVVLLVVCLPVAAAIGQSGGRSKAPSEA